MRHGEARAGEIEKEPSRAGMERSRRSHAERDAKQRESETERFRGGEGGSFGGLGSTKGNQKETPEFVQGREEIERELQKIY